tara:strand:+ start:139 stop:1002 length:864 start_codon:yes stop_codon:yes gene_type:complete
MKIGFIGLGRMGSNMVLNLKDHGHKVVGYNRTPKKIKGVEMAGSISEIGGKARIFWIMVKAGKPVDSIIKSLMPHLKKGDLIIDGGNSFYNDSIKRASMLRKKGIHFLDCGVSGGISGARNGACMMVGGEKKIFKKVEKLFKDMCVKNGYGYMGKSGAGHFVKGIHNGIEYGMMAALNEGFEVIKSEKFGTDLKEVAKVYNNGSIIESKLTNWLYDSFSKLHYLDQISCEVPEGETEKEMKFLEKKYKMPILKQARLMRVHSRSKSVCGKFISALRNEFGGHKFKRK